MENNEKGVDKQHLFLYYMSSSAAVYYRKQNNDAWLSLVERCVRDAEGSQGPVDLGFEPTGAEAETAGSNPVASTLGRGAGTFEEIQMFWSFFVEK